METTKMNMDGTPTETPRISTETAETANVSVEGENASERKETGKMTRWHGCRYRQFTRGSTLTA